MSKQFLLKLANLNLFQTTNQEIEFSIAKGNRVQAQYSNHDKEKGYDIRGIKSKSNAGVGYIRLAIAVVEGNNPRVYYNGALFRNDKKTKDNHPDFQGALNLDNQSDGEKLRLSAWKKVGEKAGEYLSIAIQEFQTHQSSQPESKPDQRQQKSRPANSASSGGFDMDDDAPEPAQAPRRTQQPQQSRVPAQPAQRVPAHPTQNRRQAAPQPAYDDDSDIPF